MRMRRVSPSGRPARATVPWPVTHFSIVYHCHSPVSQDSGEQNINNLADGLPQDLVAFCHGVCRQAGTVATECDTTDFALITL